MTTATLLKNKRSCPICSKSLSYGTTFSKHGYQVKWHQHTEALCFGAYQQEEGLVERYIAAMEDWLERELKLFPNEWLELSVTNWEHRQQREAYAAFCNARQLRRDIKYFKKSQA